MNLLTDPILLKFERANGDTVLEADLIALYIGVQSVSPAGSFLHDCIKPFVVWLKKQFNVDVTESQAYAIYRTVENEHAEFKKKFEGGLTLQPSSVSPLSDSTKD